MNLFLNQIKWHEKLHDLLLYKVCQSHDKSQRIIDENTVLDKTDVLAEILPAIDGVLYTEIVKRCGWKSLCLSVSIQAESFQFLYLYFISVYSSNKVIV